jgi:peptide/nickel transport system substrate-binding protein/microcin C transport system substrate-binding protein
MSWGAGSVDLDPKQVWHSSSAVTGGSNFINYKNPEVDKLIDQGHFENDKAKRIKIFQQVYEKIADDVPYIFMFVDKYYTYATRNRIGRPGDTFKFEVGRNYWWAAEP